MQRLLRFSAGFVLLLSLVGASAGAAEPFKLKVGVLKFGTVNWTLSVLKEKGLDQAEGVDVEVVPLSSKNATSVSLLGDAVDMIVTDWIWVSRQRADNYKFTFAPYSLTVGSVMVRPDAGIESVADLAGKRLGVAGGPVDKSWLLLRAYSRQTLGQDIADEIQPNFAAPPLLNQLMEQGDLDAALNFWHYAARLKAKGMQQLIGVDEILPALGVDGAVPLLGWVFYEDWGNENREAVLGFLRAVQTAQTLMRDSDELWDDFLRPLTKAEDDATLHALRDSFRQGIPTRFGDAEIAAAEQVFAILAELGGESLIGNSKTLDPGTFWAGSTF